MRDEALQNGEAISSEQSSGRPPLVPQPHGGAIQRGGTPGNPGGGRPPSVLRERLRGSFAERIPVLEGFADGVVPLSQRCEFCGKEPTEKLEAVLKVLGNDRLRALEIMAKYGLGVTKALSDEEVKERLRQTLATIRGALPPAQAEQLIDLIEPHWSAK